MEGSVDVRGVRRPPILAVGTVVWLASELMFFSGLFAAYFTLRAAADGPWPPRDVHLEPVVAGVFTLLLVVSSGTMQLAVRSIAAGDRTRFRRWVVWTVVLAVAFLVNQGREWAEAGFGPGSHPYGSAFFLMTGFHGLHVAGGVAGMGILLGRATDPGFGARHAPSVEVVSYYWHFVDVVWLLMFATLFFVR
ncbi:MAG: cytochrome c oxidase subunit 3 [Actinomycetota bacterium]|nr:cytochrome c oxidase subunit 3 [Actinomycetota bacterium]